MTASITLLYTLAITIADDTTGEIVEGLECRLKGDAVELGPLEGLPGGDVLNLENFDRAALVGAALLTHIETVGTDSTPAITDDPHSAASPERFAYKARNTDATTGEETSPEEIIVYDSSGTSVSRTLSRELFTALVGPGGAFDQLRELRDGPPAA